MGTRKARRLACLLLLVLGATMPASAQDLEALAARYFDAETYCEAGTYGVRISPKESFSQDKFAGCAHRDGRFRFLEHSGPVQAVTWSDGETLYRYWQSNGQYREYPLAQAAKMNAFAYRSTGAAFLQSRLSTRGAINNPSLTGYTPSGDLSTPEHMVFERRDEGWGNIDRLWVRNADKAIVKYEQARNGEVMRFVELSSQEVGRPLSDAELSHRVLSFTHVSLQNNPRRLPRRAFPRRRARRRGLLGMGLCAHAERRRGAAQAAAFLEGPALGVRRPRRPDRRPGAAQHGDLRLGPSALHRRRHGDGALVGRRLRAHRPFHPGELSRAAPGRASAPPEMSGVQRLERHQGARAPVHQFQVALSRVVA